MKRESVVVRKRILLIGLFVLLIAGITFGYARLETTLTITGDTKISKVNWLVHFKNIVVTTGSYAGPDAEHPNGATISSDGLTLTYNVTLNQPGDFYEFTADIVNDGTIEAKLDDVQVTVSDDDVASKPFISVVETGVPAKNSILQTGDTNKKRVTIRVSYPEDITPEELPSSDYTFQKTITLHYVQNR